MNKPKKTSTAASASERVTLYVKPEHQELVQWVQEHTQAKSLSEAVFMGLAELRALVKERNLQALEQTHGIWKDDAGIEEAFKELDEGWETWRRQIEGS